ncbi:hypothetical protein CC1G_15083 [Coprinopsis cinerea okayama7|uniref:Uncharacterized protein n=1 Tax=Coprinopsis cinerea (strain Okayama-7 / 130 / ATCC MYA-4618 / FGSC 9003) TaxID=240176 RepID=D6RPF0_COPC7|nr:hypothetical protein CC1G_15083 [Coprinopsis cinerea okayama7\|eukprot:XP_002910749.1 hypothetical protein CC1G_15083 [Coprinopsis cinerea okayama7\
MDRRHLPAQHHLPVLCLPYSPVPSPLSRGGSVDAMYESDYTVLFIWLSSNFPTPLDTTARRMVGSSAKVLEIRGEIGEAMDAVFGFDSAKLALSTLDIMHSQQRILMPVTDLQVWEYARPISRRMTHQQSPN